MNRVLTQNDIMVVDDNPANLKLLEDMLQQQGHEVRSFPLGRLALAAAVKALPSLILLDINMPEMNGYEVCQRLKSNPALSDVPVIFLSALNDVQDKVEAFRAGAVDYISKPFQFEEVQARVETHLKLHQLQKALKRQNECLEQAVAERTRELAEANQRLTVLDRSKNDFLRLISHELRTPLNGILGVGEIILEEMPSTEANDELRSVFQRSSRRILSIVDDALLLTEIDVSGERFRSGQVILHSALTLAMERASEFAASRGVTIAPAGLSQAGLSQYVVQADEDLLIRALQALLETTVRFSVEGETVRLAQEGLPDSIRLIMEGRGKTIPCAVLPKFFDLFAIEEASTPGKDLGLGPAVAHRILSLFGANVSVANRNECGMQLTVSLKRIASVQAP